MTDTPAHVPAAAPILAPSLLTSLARTLLLSAGGGLVTSGLISSSQENDLVGAVLVVGAGSWSILQKVIAHRRLKAAIAAPAAAI